MESKITKEKSAGRVASGKQLVEWNRKNKKSLLKDQVTSSQDQVPTSSQDQVTSSQNQVTSSHAIFGALIFIGIAFLYLQKKTSPIPPAQDDIFKMN